MGVVAATGQLFASIVPAYRNTVVNTLKHRAIEQLKQRQINRLQKILLPKLI